MISKEEVCSRDRWVRDVDMIASRISSDPVFVCYGDGQVDR